MRALVLPLAFLTSGLTSVAHAQSSRAAWAPAACASVAATYNACGTRFTTQNSKFNFATSHGPQSVACDDGQDLEYFDRLAQMDISSLFRFPYVLGSVPLPEVRQDWDPGRLRSEDLLKAVFGEDEAHVRANLVKVSFLGQTIAFQKNLGAAAALEKIGRELTVAAQQDRTLEAFLLPFTSKKIDLRLYTMNWRPVKGTTRLSPHSFGTAIDLLLQDGPQYWLWDAARQDPARAAQGETAFRNVHFVPPGAPRFHAKAVEIFEKNGFIWGGKWNHYDTMHFEYRPEFVAGLTPDCALTIRKTAIESDSLLVPVAYSTGSEVVKFRDRFEPATDDLILGGAIDHED